MTLCCIKKVATGVLKYHSCDTYLCVDDSFSSSSGSTNGAKKGDAESVACRAATRSARVMRCASFLGGVKVTGK